MKNFLRTCKDEILNFEVKSVREDIRRNVESIMDTHSYSFQRENIYKASQSTVLLRDWIVAVVEFSKTYERVRPL
jgi:hypothetical protein